MIILVAVVDFSHLESGGKYVHLGKIGTELDVSEKQKTEKLNYLWICFFYRRRFG